MYRGFNLRIDKFPKDKEINAPYYTEGCKIFNEHERALKNNINKLILTDGTLDGSTLQAQWFPQVEADIFISHSHSNADEARVIAGYLHKEFNLKCFVDTTIWGYGADLLRDLDNSYCRKDTGYYDYSLRNISTSHVYLMLASAIMQMINNTECLFFLNSESSIKPAQVMDSTISPWLYFEIIASQNIGIKLPAEHARRQRIIEKSFSNDQEIITESLAITHKIHLGHLTEVNATSEWFNTWRVKAIRKTFKLDSLYDMLPVKSF